MMNKKCNKCLIKKELSQYFKDKSGKYGVANLCKKCKKEYNKLRRVNNQVKIKNKAKKYYIDNKEIIKEKAIIYYNKNKDWLLIKKSEYKKTEYGAEKERLYVANRRCRIITTSDNTINIKSTQKLLDEQGGVCNMCGVDIMNRKERHLDHIEPISKGGPHSISNVQWLCVHCNLVKGNR